MHQIISQYYHSVLLLHTFTYYFQFNFVQIVHARSRSYTSTITRQALIYMHICIFFPITPFNVETDLKTNVINIFYMQLTLYRESNKYLVQNAELHQIN